MRLRFAIGIGLALVLANPAIAAPRAPTVAGSFDYYLWDHLTSVQLAARGGDEPTGNVRFSNPYVEFTGDVRCVQVVDGQAWVAGAVTRGYAMDQSGWSGHVLDGGQVPDGGDAAIFFIDSLENVLAWCEARDVSWDELAAPEPFTRGNVVVAGQ